MTDRSTLRDLAHEATIIASLAEGLSVLEHEAEGLEHGNQCPMAKRASNALVPAIDIVIEKLWALTDAIEEADRAMRTEGDSREGA